MLRRSATASLLRLGAAATLSSPVAVNRPGPVHHQRASFHASSPRHLFGPNSLFNSDFDWFINDPFFSSAPTPFYRLEQGPKAPTSLTAHELENGDVEVEMELPRYRPEDVKVTTDTETGLVTIEASRPKSGSMTKGKADPAPVKRTFTASLALFDLTKLSSKVEHGVLTITLNRKPKPAPQITQVPIEGSSSSTPKQAVEAPTAAKGAQVAVADARRPQWPPRMELVQKPADGVATAYTVTLPPSVHPENVTLQVLEGNRLRVDVAFSTRRETKHGVEEHSASFARIVPLPEGAKAENVKAKLDEGRLTIEVLK
jgi:HSP20 family molecular chaperone IbpA